MCFYFDFFFVCFKKKGGGLDSLFDVMEAPPTPTATTTNLRSSQAIHEPTIILNNLQSMMKFFVQFFSTTTTTTPSESDLAILDYARKTFNTKHVDILTFICANSSTTPSTVYLLDSNEEKKQPDPKLVNSLRQMQHKIASLQLFSESMEV